MNAIRPLLSFALFSAFAVSVHALPVRVVDAQGKPLPTVMVSVAPVTPATIDASDNGYAEPGKPQRALFETHRFTNAAGATDLPTGSEPWKLRLRKPGFKDVLVEGKDYAGEPLVMAAETDPMELAAQKPSNVWTSTVDFGDENLKK